LNKFISNIGIVTIFDVLGTAKDDKFKGGVFTDDDFTNDFTDDDFTDVFTDDDLEDRPEDFGDATDDIVYIISRN